MKLRDYFGIDLLFIIAIFSVTVSSGVSQKQTHQQHDTLYTYKKNIFPMLQANCNPCHFPGGKVWNKLPFDNYKTVASLGKKLNTRLKEKKQKTIINEWVEQGSKEKD